MALVETGTAEAKTQAAGALSTMVVANADNQSTVAQNLVAMLSQDTSSNEAQVSHILASSWALAPPEAPSTSAHHGARSPATGLRQLLYSLMTSDDLLIASSGHRNPAALLPDDL